MQVAARSHPAHSFPSSSSAPDPGTELTEVLPVDLLLRVRQILCNITSEDIANMKPGYFQELVTLSHLVIRR